MEEKEEKEEEVGKRRTLSDKNNSSQLGTLESSSKSCLTHCPGSDTSRLLCAGTPWLPDILDVNYQ